MTTPGYRQPPAQVSVKSFGAIGNGIADDTTAVQNAINYLTGPAAPSSNTRLPLAALYFPAGIYKVTADLVIQYVEGFRMTGDGPGITTIYASGTGFTTAVLLIDGSADGVFEGFQIEGD